MLPDKETGCHRTGFAKTCYACVVEHRCRLWQNIRGTNPNTGQELDQWGCADQFRNMLLIENSKEQRQTGAAVESFRNEVVRMNAAVLVAYDPMKFIDTFGNVATHDPGHGAAMTKLVPAKPSKAS